jgi:protein-tyrosine phosphatase
MVCLGNICRSPMAEGLLHEKITKHKLVAKVDSAGFESFHLNDTPDFRAVQVMSSHGIDISKYRMRLFHESDFDLFDRIFVMDRQNYRDVISMARNEKDKRKVDYILNVLEPGSDRMVPDPYYGGISGFDKVFEMLDKATDVLVTEIKKENK